MNKRFIKLQSVFLFFGLLTISTQSFTQDCNAAYQEKDGRVIIEAENLSYSGSWKKQTDAKGYTGSGYISWTGSDYFNNPGNGKITVKIKINTSGTYRFQWRTKVGQGSSTTDYNDTWLRFPDASDYWGEKNDKKVYPKGTGKTPNPQGASKDGWFKVYSKGTTQWTWSSSVNDNNAYLVYVKFNKPGTYKMELSVRSKKHFIDRIALYRAGVEGTELKLKETKCDDNGGISGNCIEEVNYPGGRIALSFDGNQHDPDDIVALPVSLALLKAAGLQNKVVHVEHSNHICNNNSSQHNKMKVSAKGCIDNLGYKSSIIFDFYSNNKAATNHLRDQINASSSKNKLWIICAGPMESVWRAIKAADANKRQYVTCISHHTWNDNHGDCGANSHKWSDIGKFESDGLIREHIKDQNAGKDLNKGFSTHKNKWFWMRDSKDPVLNWLYERNPFGKKFDPSDCGMAYWLLTGGPNGGDENGSAPEAKKLLENPCSSGGGPEGYTFACNEGQTVQVSGTMNVAYGANGKFEYLYNQSSNIPCNNSTFGDPIKNVVKKCYVQSVDNTINDLEGVYAFKNVNSSKYMGTDPKGIVKLGNTSKYDDYKWKLTNSSDEYYNISNIKSGRGVLSSDGNGLVQWNTIDPVTTDADKQWKAEHISGNIYRFNNKHSGRNYLCAIGDGGVGYKSTADKSTEWELVSDTKSTLGLSKNELSGINIFPNPASTSFTIDLNGMKNATVLIYNMNGQTVLQTKAFDGITIDNNFKAGIYMVQAVDDQGNSHSRKLMVD